MSDTISNRYFPIMGMTWGEVDVFNLVRTEGDGLGYKAH